MPSLSSKLRNFHKELKKKETEKKKKKQEEKKEGKTSSTSSSNQKTSPETIKSTSPPLLLPNEEQLASIARHMPRDADSLGKILSPEQMDAFGEELLTITCGHTSRDQAKFEDCLLEIDAFVRGGVPGMDCLNRVYPTILKHYGVSDDAEEVLEALKLYMNAKENKLKRKWVKDTEEEEEQVTKGARLSQ